MEKSKNTFYGPLYNSEQLIENATIGLNWNTFRTSKMSAKTVYEHPGVPSL